MAATPVTRARRGVGGSGGAAWPETPVRRAAAVNAAPTRARPRARRPLAGGVGARREAPRGGLHPRAGEEEPETLRGMLGPAGGGPSGTPLRAGLLSQSRFSLSRVKSQLSWGQGLGDTPPCPPASAGCGPSGARAR